MDWQERFIQLYTSESSDDFDEALELKRKNIPSKLYRYRPITDVNIIHRVREIVFGELFLSHPKDLNDPFEVCSMLQSDRPGPYFQEKALFVKLYKDKMTRKDFDRIFTKENFIEDLIEHIARKSVATETAEETKKSMLDTCMSVISAISSEKDKYYRSATRLACFSTTPNNLPMWHHYTNGHTGMCFEFDTANITERYQIDRLFPVNYVDVLPDTTYLIAQRTTPATTILEYQAMHKLKDWSYEKEWRSIYCVDAFYSGLHDVPKEFWEQGKAIEFIRPSRIILGMNIAADHEEIIHKTAKQCGIPVTKAECTAFGIKTE